jgi:hypothetical protein
MIIVVEGVQGKRMRIMVVWLVCRSPLAIRSPVSQGYSCTYERKRGYVSRVRRAVRIHFFAIFGCPPGTLDSQERYPEAWQLVVGSVQGYGGLALDALQHFVVTWIIDRSYDDSVCIVDI